MKGAAGKELSVCQSSALSAAAALLNTLTAMLSECLYALGSIHGGAGLAIDEGVC